MSDRSTVFPFVNMSGLVMYDANGKCTHCGHHADAHHSIHPVRHIHHGSLRTEVTRWLRGCIHRGRWSPAELCPDCVSGLRVPDLTTCHHPNAPTIGRMLAEWQSLTAALAVFGSREGDAR